MYKKVVKLDDYRPNLIIDGANYIYSLPKDMLEDYATGKRETLTPDLLRGIVREWLIMQS